jgi:hypothetical protein
MPFSSSGCGFCRASINDLPPEMRILAPSAKFILSRGIVRFWIFDYPSWGCDLTMGNFGSFDAAQGRFLTFDLARIGPEYVERTGFGSISLAQSPLTMPEADFIDAAISVPLLVSVAELRNCATPQHPSHENHQRSM